MKMGLVACAFLASGFTAFADTTATPVYKSNGDVCTADEAAGRVKESYRGRTFNTPVKCRTASEWKLFRAMLAEQDREWDRFRNRLAAGETGEGALSPPLRPTYR